MMDGGTIYNTNIASAV